MKGIIFTSFIEFAEQNLGADFVDQMLDDLPLSTGGAYTSVGTYPTSEIVEMITYVLGHVDHEPSALQEAFGQHTFGVLARQHPNLVNRFADSFDCIHEVDQTIHTNVRKLYPDAELPNLNARYGSDGQTLNLDYHSERPFMHLALGLIKGCIAHFGDDAVVRMTDRSDGAGTRASFVLTRRGETARGDPMEAPR